MTIRFEPRDIWVGLYWDRQDVPWRPSETHYYVCLIPCIVIHWVRRRRG